MIYVYGSYQSNANEFTPAWSERIERSQFGEPMKKVVVISLDGWKLGNAAAIASQMTAIQQAFSVDDRDFLILDDDGGLFYQLRKDDTLSGIKVIEPPHIPEARGADLAVRGHYRLSLQAEILIPNSALGINTTFNFTQTVQVQGGGPIIVPMICTTGPPVLQRVAERTPFVAIQSGSFSSYSPNALIPKPLWPAARIDSRQPRVTQSVDGAARTMRYDFTWDYEFLSATPLTLG